MNSVLFLVLLFLISCVACKSPISEYMTIDGQAQGTTFQIEYRDSLCRDFSKQVDSLFRVMDQSMSLWDSTSTISRLNRKDISIIPDEHFIRVFNRAMEIASETKGAFDVTVGPLIKAWRIHQKDNTQLPDTAQVDSIKGFVGYKKVHLIDESIVKDDPRIELDFNGIAQGYTVDVISNFFLQRGIRHFLVEVGGELRTMGFNGRGENWHIGIDKPTDQEERGRPLQTIVDLKDVALATSGSYRKYVMKDGQKLSHVIDPVTGYPIDQKLMSVSVKAENCMSADAYATAFLVMGLESAMAFAKEKKLEIYCIYSDAEGSHQVKATPGFTR